MGPAGPKVRYTVLTGEDALRARRALAQGRLSSLCTRRARRNRVPNCLVLLTIHHPSSMSGRCTLPPHAGAAPHKCCCARPPLLFAPTTPPHHSPAFAAATTITRWALQPAVAPCLLRSSKFGPSARRAPPFPPHARKTAQPLRRAATTHFPCPSRTRRATTILHPHPSNDRSTTVPPSVCRSQRGPTCPAPSPRPPAAPSPPSAAPSENEW